MKETIFEIGYDKNNELDFSIKGVFYQKLTREQYNEILKMTFYCLKELEKFGIKESFETMVGGKQCIKV